MEKFYQSMKKPLSRGLILLMLLFVSMTTKATDFTEVELGSTYSIEKIFGTFYGKWTAPSDGTLNVNFTGGSVAAYTDEAMTSAVTVNTIVGQKVTLDATSGTTYYFRIESQLSKKNEFNFSFVSSGSEVVTLESVSPEAGSTLDVTGKGTISIKFADNVNVENVLMTSGTNSVSLESHCTNTYLTIDFKSALYNWIKSDAVKEGDAVTFTLSGITLASNSSVKYGEDGTYSVSFKAPKAPVYLVSTTAPSIFKTEWESGDADGIVTFTFSGNLMQGATATLSVGTRDYDGQYYTEDLTPVVSGNTITVDLTGKRRALQELLPNADLTSATAGDAFKYFTLKVSGVKDAEGNTAYSDAQGAIGSFSVSMPLDESETSYQTINTEFTPASGGSLKGMTTMNIWFDNPNKVDFTGVKFAYDATDGSRTEAVVAKSDLTFSAADVEEADITVTLPEGVASASNVTVSLDGLTVASGYTGKFVAYYNESGTDFTATLIQPVEGCELDSIREGDIIKISANPMSDISFITYQIDNATTGETVKSFSEFTNPTDGSNIFTAEVYGNYKLLKDNEYTIKVIAYKKRPMSNPNNKLGEASFTIKGTTEPYVFSDVKFVSVDPSEDIMLTSADQNKFTVTYSDAVTLDKTLTFLDGEYTGTTHAFQSIEPADASSAETIDGKTYASSWVLTADESYMKATTTILGFSIKAYDKNGLLVEGNQGTESESYTRVEYEAPIGVPDLTITPAAGNVDKLEAITVSYSGGIDMSWMVNEKKAVITDSEGNVVTYVASTDTKSSSVVLTLAEPVTAAGTYTLTIPYMYFLMGSDMYTMYNRETTVKYTIVGSSATYTLAPSSIDPADDSEVETLESIKLTFDEDVVVNSNVSMPVIVDNLTTGESVSTAVEVYSDPQDTKSVYVDFGEDTPITTAGYYNVTIAQGVIGDAAYGESGFTSGNATAELSLYYQVKGTDSGETDNVVADPADGSTVSSLSKITLTWPDEEVVGDNTPSSTSIKLTDADGNVVATASVELDWDAFNVAHLTLSNEITAAGTYTLTIPAESFSFGDWGDTYSTAYTFTYTIEGTTGINGVAADANGKYSIFGVDGVAVKANASKADLNSLKSGLYIINGKKIVVKK